MMQFYFGNTQEYITAEYAKSGRSTCKACKQKIQNNTIRLGICIDDDHFAASYWYHLNCFTLKPRHKELAEQEQIFQKIYGIDDLDPQDFDLVVQHLQKQLKRITEGKKAPIKRTSSKLSDKKQQEKNQKVQKQKQQVKSSKKDMKNSKKNQKKQQNKQHFTQVQDAEYKKLVQDYMKHSTDHLKYILQVNHQTKTGSKTQLAEKCADGRQLGKIPSCGTCFGGKLRFDRQTASYKCPGFMQDQTFKRCGAKFTFDDIKRQPWTQP